VVPVWLSYSLVRLALFGGSFAALLLVLGTDNWIWAALLATVIAFCLSFIFLRRQRDRIALDLQARGDERRRAKATRDEDAEDAADPGDPAR
jgi:hypothetical protein